MPNCGCAEKEHLERAGREPVVSYAVYSGTVNRPGVVVAHSLAGSTGTFVAARRPVRHLVYLCAAVPAAGHSFYDQWQEQPDMVNPEWDMGLSKPDEQLRYPDA
jgi:hypothetical protein